MAYPKINSILSKNAVESSAAEVHGIATGLLCVNDQQNGSYWLSELLQLNETIDNDSRLLLLSLFEETRRLLISEDFEFELFLPDDKTTLNERTEALANWCHGFLYGIGLLSSSNSWSENAREIIKDITEFTRLDTGAKGEEDEFAFMEITEYLKSAILLLHDELNNKP